MAPTQGLLIVTMQPKPALTPSAFHDWYNNEHGPSRLRLPFILNGLRYRAKDLGGQAGTDVKPEWVALYDITDMDELTHAPYTTMRLPQGKTQRETDVMAQITTGRKVYDDVEDKKSEDWIAAEDLRHETSDKGTLIVTVTYNSETNSESDWSTEHGSLAERKPGWTRTRRFKTSRIEDQSAAKETLVLYEFQPGSDVSFVKELPKPAKGTVRDYELYYTFGPGPRYLGSPMADFESKDGQTKTSSRPQPTIESYVTTNDGAVLNYRLEGSSDPHAPLIVLSNSILVTWDIWTPFVNQLLKSHPQYRILRYNTRGRTSAVGKAAKITMDLLSSDIICLLDALRVPRAAALLGVSLGGATVLNAALQKPHRISSFVSCDTSAAAPEGNSKAWLERIEIAEKDAHTDSASGRQLVGPTLAKMTTERWFTKESYEGSDQALKERIEETNQMVIGNDLEGFKASVQALWEYDVWPMMGGYTGKGAFLVGKQDGKLPEGMAKMAKGLGKGVSLYEVEGAGHLPMVEKPDQFYEYVVKFLDGE